MDELAATGRAPRVSVGLPVYNGERYVAAAIEGILGQDFDDLELIISDNASTDGTEEIARSYAARDPRVRYVRNERNVGAARNYNAVVELARGEYFRWQSHDDVSAPGFVGRCVEALDDDPGVIVAFPRVAAIDEHGERLYDYPSSAYATEARPSQRARGMLRLNTECLESFGLTRRDQLLRTSMIGAYTGSDRTLFLQWALLGRFREIDEVLMFHRQHPGRSVQRFRDDRARNAWFDPDRASARTSPRWRLLYEYARSIAVAPVPVRERVLAATGLAGWASTNRRALARELVVSVGVRPARRPAAVVQEPAAG